MSSSRAEREALRAASVSKLVSLLPAHEQRRADLYVDTDTFPAFAAGAAPSPTDSPNGGPALFGLDPFFVPLGTAPPHGTSTHAGFETLEARY